MVRRRAGHTDQDLHRVARDAAPATVVERTAEPRLVAVVGVEVHVLVVLQTVEVVEFQTWAHNALLHKLRRVTLRESIVVVASIATFEAAGLNFFRLVF